MERHILFYHKLLILSKLTCTFDMILLKCTNRLVFEPKKLILKYRENENTQEGFLKRRVLMTINVIRYKEIL